MLRVPYDKFCHASGEFYVSSFCLNTFIVWIPNLSEKRKYVYICVYLMYPVAMLEAYSVYLHKNSVRR